MPSEEKPKRLITPHKGGRNAAFPHSRLTQEAHDKLKRILAHRQITAADWAEEKIEQEYRTLFEDQAH